MRAEIIEDSRYNWKTESIFPINVLYIGRYKSVKNLVEYLKKIETFPNMAKVNEIIENMTGNFAVIVEADDWILGLTDRVSGYRVFYKNNNIFHISNSPRVLIDNNSSVDQSSIIEMKMAGYLTGDKTIYNDIHQMPPGGVLLFNKLSGNLTIDNYFKFYSSKLKQQGRVELIEILDSITNTIIKRNIKDANGRTIWVPLSGGLDSRLIVCKLKQLGYDKIRTYSYGVVGNFDAIRAKDIANTLNLKWEFIPTTAAESRKYFLSKERKKYWDFADGLSVIPNSHGTFALDRLLKSGKMRVGDVVINGQSGDFITGQHIPLLSEEKVSVKLLLEHILKKNYSLRGDLLNDKKLVRIMNDNILNVLGNYKHVYNYQDFAKSFEYWGWKERQSKRVINGQSNYDYLGLSWELPLWDLEYMQFWVDMPIDKKIGRNLFVEYLNKMNFYGVFDNSKFMSRWPLNRLYIQFFGNILSRVMGENISSLYYKKIDWYSQYQYLYALTGKSEYNKHWRNYKGGYPYKTDIWLAENLKSNDLALDTQIL